MSFRNYRSSRLIEFADYSRTLINADNKFARLLVRVSGSLDQDMRIAIEAFFRSLRTNARHNFEELRARQRHILELLMTSGLVNRDEMEDYLLTKDDFGPHLIRAH